MSNWYREGFVSIVSGSDLVDGVGTHWNDNALPGGIFFSPDGLYEVLAVVSDNRLRLSKAYTGISVEDAEYAIAPTQAAVVSATKAIINFNTSLGALYEEWQAGGLNAKGLVLKGTKNAVGELPSSGNTAGDGWMVDGVLYVWSGTAWTNQGQLVSSDEVVALRDQAMDAKDGAVEAKVVAEDAAAEIRNRIYPGVQSTPPETKPDGEPCAPGDRCLILTDGTPRWYTFVDGVWTIEGVDAVLFAAADGAGRVGTPDGTVQDALDARATLDDLSKNPKLFPGKGVALIGFATDQNTLPIIIENMPGGDGLGLSPFATACMHASDKARNANGHLVRGIVGHLSSYYLETPVLWDGMETLRPGSVTINSNQDNGSSFSVDLGTVYLKPGIGTGFEMKNMRFPYFKLRAKSPDDAVHPAADEVADVLFTASNVEGLKLRLVGAALKAILFDFDGTKGRLVATRHAQIYGRTCYKTARIVGDPAARNSFTGMFDIYDLLPWTGSYLAYLDDLTAYIEDVIIASVFSSPRGKTIEHCASIDLRIKLGNGAAMLLDLLDVNGTLTNAFLFGDPGVARNAQTTTGVRITDSRLNILSLLTANCLAGLEAGGGANLNIATEQHTHNTRDIKLKQGIGASPSIEVTRGSWTSVGPYAESVVSEGFVRGKFGMGEGRVIAGNVGGAATAAFDFTSAATPDFVVDGGVARNGAEYGVGVSMYVMSSFIGRLDSRSAVPLKDTFGKIGTPDGLTYDVNLPALTFGTGAAAAWFQNTERFPVRIVAPHKYTNGAVPLTDFVEMQTRKPAGTVYPEARTTTPIAITSVEAPAIVSGVVPTGYSYQFFAGNNAAHVQLLGTQHARKASS